MNTTKLKPCPFCGGEAVFHTISSEHGIGSVGFCFDIRCASCKTALPRNYRIEADLSKNGTLEMTKDGRSDAIEAWNRRVDK